MANTEIRRTSGSTPTNAEKFTLSLWFKKSKNAQSSERGLLGWRENSNSGNNSLQVEFQTTDKFQVQFKSNNGNDTHINLVTNRQLRDTSAWYHLVIAVDSSQTTASDRAKIYFNGVQETSFSSATYPANGRTFFSNDIQINFGKSRGTTNTDRFFNGAMSHIHFIDGTQYQASDFGEYDANGVWKIKTSPSVTYGNNGFFWLKDGIATTDYSPNSNTWISGGGTLTKTEDNPSNVFTTLNSLYRDGGSVITYSNGNNTCDVGGANDWCTSPSTLGATSGKFYFEGKFTINSGTEGYIGIAQDGNLNVKTNVPNYLGIDNYSIGYYSGNGKYYRATSSFTYGNTFTTGDIVGCAVDIDNKKIYFSKNGVWQNSGDPTSGSTGTGAIPIDANTLYTPRCTIHNMGMSFNFGTGFFGTTAITTNSNNGYAGAEGASKFNYSVPTGYSALNTKGLNQ